MSLRMMMMIKKTRVMKVLHEQLQMKKEMVEILDLLVLDLFGSKSLLE
jgi:hypothetical protein